MLATLCTIVVVQWGNRKFDVLTISCYRRVVATIELKFRLVSIEKRAAIYRALVLCSVWSYLPITYYIFDQRKLFCHLQYRSTFVFITL